MRDRIALLVIVGVTAGVACGSALADPPSNNGHNCSGFASTFVPEENLGESVRFLAHLYPTAIPSELDNANCGGNGFPPG